MFSVKTLDFLVENRLMNSRAWFAEHREQYENDVQKPLTELAVALAPTMAAIDPLIVTTPKTDKTISRIYRDTRFSKNKLLYREEMWLSFRRDKKASPRYPEFFFVFSPNGLFYGCGYYSATPEAMESMRSLVLADDPAFLRANKTALALPGLLMDADRYKKTKFPDQPADKRAWLDCKNLAFAYKNTDFPLLFSDALAPTLAGVFRDLSPIYDFFIHAEHKAIQTAQK